MMTTTTEKEDLGLSLSLSTSVSRFPLKLTLFPSLGAPSTSKARCAYSDEEEAGGAWSPVSTLSGPSGKRSDRPEENEGEEDGYSSSKKLRLSKDQTVVLEEGFKENSTLNPKQKQALAKQLNLRPRQVEVWFQNRRARTKLKQTEVECEYLKRWCQNLAEENKRLQKEVMELRAANKVSSIPTANYNTNLSSSSSSLQLLHGHSLSQHYHLNASPAAAANSNPWALYFSQEDSS